MGVSPGNETDHRAKAVVNLAWFKGEERVMASNELGKDFGQCHRMSHRRGKKFNSAALKRLLGEPKLDCQGPGAGRRDGSVSQFGRRAA